MQSEFFKLASSEETQDSVPFNTIQNGQLFYCSGSLYIKTHGVVIEVCYPHRQVGQYNAFNLRTLKVGQYKPDTMVYRVTAEPFKYTIQKASN